MPNAGCARKTGGGRPEAVGVVVAIEAGAGRGARLLASESRTDLRACRVIPGEVPGFRCQTLSAMLMGASRLARVP